VRIRDRFFKKQLTRDKKSLQFILLYDFVIITWKALHRNPCNGSFFKGFMHQQELYHEVFGSILDRTEMTPYLLRNCDDYRSALNQATLMIMNRGFDIIGNDLSPGEAERAQVYIRQARKYFSGWLFPFLKKQISLLALCDSPQIELYTSSLSAIENLEQVLSDKKLSVIIAEDPRHLFLLSSSIKYPNIF